MTLHAPLATPAASRGHIEVRNLGIQFETRHGRLDAVSDVSLHVRPGEFVGLFAGASALATAGRVAYLRRR